MDPRRRLIAAIATLALPGCAALGPPRAQAPAPRMVTPHFVTPPMSATRAATPPVQAIPRPDPPAPPRTFATMAPIPNPAPAPAAGPAAIARANREALTTSRTDRFVGGEQVFAWGPGRIYEVRAAPLRVTVLSFVPGEAIVAKAAGDTVRWQIGETTSGSGAARRAHVVLKPLSKGLATDLVLTTTRRVYLIALRSGPPETFNAAVTWDVAQAPSLSPPSPPPPTDPAARVASPPPARPAGPIDADYDIAPKGHAPAWTPVAVFNDGTRTFIALPAAAATGEAPALFGVAPDGERQMVNYRQAHGVLIVDQVLERAELRLGRKRPQVVRIVRRAEGRR